jgi:hypothetical protein
VTTDGPSTQRSTGDRPATTAELLEALRDRMVPSAPPAPSDQLRTAFESGLGATPPPAAPMPRPARARRRRLAAVGAVAVLALGGTGAAGALPGSAQDAFDRTAEAVGLSRRATPVQVPPADPASPAELEVERQPDDVGSNPAGRIFAEERVVPDATDATSPGIDDPSTVAEDGRDLGPEDPATDGTQHAPVDTPAPAPTERPGPGETPGPTSGDEAPAPADPIAPERPGAGDEPRTSRPGGAP